MFIGETKVPAVGEEGVFGSRSDMDQKLEDKMETVSKPSAPTAGPGWTKVSCPCCVSQNVEPMVFVKLGEQVRPETKRWLIRLIGASQKDGGMFKHSMMILEIVKVSQSHSQQP